MSEIDLGSDLLNYLIRQGYCADDRIPSLAELKEDAHLGISISKVREQLEVARALGLVEVRSKTGTRLKPYSFAPAVRLSLLYAIATDLNYFEMFGALRIHLEMAFWHEACACITPEDTAIMRDCITNARAKLADDWIRIPNSEHRTFHLTVFRNLENPFIIGLLEAYWDAYETIEITRYADLDYHRSVWDYHERILNAIEAGDYDEAQTAFIEHTRLIRYTPKEQHTSNNDNAS